MKAAVLVLTAACLTACASAPTPQQQLAADYGEPIEQPEAERLAKAYLSQRLKDPQSAIFECGTADKGYIEAAPLVGQKMQFGYLISCTVNAKNSFGGYTGAKPYQFLIRNGQIVGALGQECLSGGGCYMAPLR